VEDKQSDIRGLLADIAPEVGLIATTIDLSKSKHDGLRAYEQGYAKEGVGAGGLLTLAALKGYGEDEVLKLIEGEYERLMGIGLS
jgi:NaMN:DMB phosphoribosyltransferase